MERTNSTFGNLLIVGGVLGVAGLAGVFFGHTSGQGNGFESYLFGFVFWMVLTIGCLALVILKHATKGGWGNTGLRIWEAGSKNVPLMALLVIPIIFFGLKDLYPWMNQELIAKDSVLQWKTKYLDQTWFIIRTVIYFASWILIMMVLNRLSAKQDENNDNSLLGKRMTYASVFAVLFVLTNTFAMTDWVMSLEKHWYSMIFGLLMTVSGALAALCVALIILVNSYDKDAYKKFINFKTWRDYGNLLFTLLVLWTYMAFSQFLITWSGNLPEEITYFLDRKEGVWEYIGIGIIFLHFLFPFLILLSSRVKRTPHMLGAVAAWILLMRVFETSWAVLPSFHREGAQVTWMDASAFIGIGGLWLACFAWNYARTKRLIPVYADPVEQKEHAHA